jgi:hypothetical protein
VELLYLRHARALGILAQSDLDGDVFGFKDIEAGRKPRGSSSGNTTPNWIFRAGRRRYRSSTWNNSMRQASGNRRAFCLQKDIIKKLEHRKFEVKFFDLDCYWNCLCLQYHSPVTNRRNSLSGIHARYQSTPPNSNPPQAMHIVHLSCHEPIAIIISQSTEKEEGEEKKEFSSSSSNLLLPSMHPIRSSKPPICNRDQ